MTKVGAATPKKAHKCRLSTKDGKKVTTNDFLQMKKPQLLEKCLPNANVSGTTPEETSSFEKMFGFMWPNVLRFILFHSANSKEQNWSNSNQKIKNVWIAMALLSFVHGARNWWKSNGSSRKHKRCDAHPRPWQHICCVKATPPTSTAQRHRLSKKFKNGLCLLSFLFIDFWTSLICCFLSGNLVC